MGRPDSSRLKAGLLLTTRIGPIEKMSEFHG